MKTRTELVFNGVTKYFNEVSLNIVKFLERQLPLIFDDWWTKTVLNRLSVDQLQRLELSDIVSLNGLNMSELLCVLDQNWDLITKSMDLNSQQSNLFNNITCIFNRWVNSDVEDLSFFDMYQDLDTLRGFSVFIGVDAKLIQNIDKIKLDLQKLEISSESESSTETKYIDSDKNKKNTGFEPGQIVYIKSNTSIRGAVVAVLPGNPEKRYNVFIDGSIQTFYASQLQAGEESEVKENALPIEQFHAYLSSLQIKYPGLSTLYSLNAARIDFIPYQFRPVLKFIQSDRPRLLIADGVGVGKTIEAGLILRELQARREMRSILIICPRPLVVEKKWQNEMKRFEERFNHLDGVTLRYCINEMDLDGVWPEQHQKVIVPYSLFDESLLYGSAPGGNKKRKRGLLDLDPPPRFDLVIVDEAHHVRNQDTFAHKAVRFFCDNAEAVVFLTATPIQLGTNDLFVLLNMLRPDLIIDQESFAHMADPNPFINQAVSAMRAQVPSWQNIAHEALGNAGSTPWGKSILSHNPFFTRIRTELLKSEITHEERVKMISETEGLHTFAGIINRTRRRDIGAFTIRRPETISVPFTPEQQLLHDELLKIQAEIFSQIHAGVNVPFMMTTIRRQAASSIFGLAPFLEGILSRHLDELFWEEAGVNGIPENESINPIQNQINDILKMAQSLESNDPKFEALLSIIRDKQELPNNKIMLFSSFRHTLSYLYDHLNNKGFRVGLVHGGTSDEDRVIFRTRFEKSREDENCIDLLLFSEIGCEGLDYQFCDCMVNYDLPWNPMKVEQRIGRIDRNGQKSESVSIFNLITPGTVDADIYERCLLRIGVFNNALGGSEEILGEITSEIKSIAENYELSEAERNIKFQQLADNKIRLIQEQEILETKQIELFGIHLPLEQFNREIVDASSFWLSPNSLQRLATLYLQRVCGKKQEFVLGEKPLKTLRLAQEYRNILLKDFHKLPRQNTSIYRDWENWLKGESQHLLITFESNCAIQYSDAAFIMPLHPLIKQAALSFDTTQKIITNLSVISNKVPAGQYEFAIYQWRYQGITEDMKLKPIAVNPDVTDHFNSLLENATDSQDVITNNLNTSIWNNLDDQHYTLWKEARTLHREKTKELSEYQRESISTSHRARIGLLEAQFNLSQNDKIKKMRQSQIIAAESDYMRRIQKLDAALEEADIIAGPVAYGVIHISKGVL